MPFQNDDQLSKLKELTKISGGIVWSDSPKLTIIVCHLIRIVLPNYCSLYYLGCISEMLGTREKSNQKKDFFCGKNHVFSHGKRDIERKSESRVCFSGANIFALLKLKKWNGYRCIRNTCGTNLLLACFNFVYTTLEKIWKNYTFFFKFSIFCVIELLFKFHSIYSMAENYVWCINCCRYYTDCKKYIVSHSKYNRFVPS